LALHASLPPSLQGRGSTMSQLDVGDDDKAAVFQGGNYVDLHQMLGVRAGSDILRSKKVRCACKLDST
jgi:hypothetical protein